MIEHFHRLVDIEHRSPPDLGKPQVQSGERATHSAPVVALAGQRADLPELTPARPVARRTDEPAAFSRGGGG